jgi:integrase
MAAVSRIAFETLRIRRLSNEDDKQQPEIEPMFPGDDPALVLSEIKGYLKAHIPIINSDHIQPSPEQQKLMNALKGIVQVNREIDRGVDANPIIAENADLLRNRYIQILSAPAGTDPASSPVPTQAGSERLSFTPPDPAPHLSPSQFSEKLQPTPRLQPQKMTVGSLGQTMAPGDAISAVDRDRRYVPRPQSTKPLFSVVSEEYLQARAGRSGEDDPDVGTARMRRDIFIDLIGDHPVDTYNGSDLQAFVNLLKFWPANVTKRKDAAKLTPRELIESNRDLHLQPLKLKSLKEGYVAGIKAMMRHKMGDYEYRDPFAGVRIHWPDTAAPSTPREPLSNDLISRAFRLGAKSEILDEAMVPLLAYLTGRRLGLLASLQGQDLRQKYRGVWVAQTAGIVLKEGKWVRVPYKTNASATFFVLHQFLEEIGFVEWASKQDGFIFKQLAKLADPSKSASSYMNRLLDKAGRQGKGREVFHSLRGTSIEGLRDQRVDSRSRRLQVGHDLMDEHEIYGFRALSEKDAREIARLPLPKEIDFSVFRGLDFERMASTVRGRGRRPSQARR